MFFITGRVIKILASVTMTHYISITFTVRSCYTKLYEPSERFQNYNAMIHANLNQVGGYKAHKVRSLVEKHVKNFSIQVRGEKKVFSLHFSSLLVLEVFFSLYQHFTLHLFLFLQVSQRNP